MLAVEVAVYKLLCVCGGACVLVVGFLHVVGASYDSCLVIVGAEFGGGVFYAVVGAVCVACVHASVVVMAAAFVV